jgi:hypothetical protein
MTSIGKDTDKPQKMERITKEIMDKLIKRTTPTRSVSQPVIGSAIALPTEKEVIT